MAGNTYTWIGGSASASNPAGWFPSGQPQSGDTVIINSGTVVFVDRALQGNTVDLNAGTLEFVTDTVSAVATIDAASAVVAGTSANAAIDFLGTATNAGTIAVVANTVTLDIAAYTGTAGAIAGALSNSGIVEVSNGASLAIVGQFGDTNGGHVLVNGGTVSNTASYSQGSYTLTSNSTANLLGVDFGQTIVFAGTNDVVRFTPGGTGTPQTILGFGQGDTIDIGSTAAIGSIVYDYSGFGGAPGSSSGPVMAVYGTTGALLFSAAVTDAMNHAVGGNTGTFAATLLASGTLAAGFFEIGTAADGYTTISELPPSTWSLAGTTFTLISGPGNPSGHPNSGDTVIANGQTFSMNSDSTLNGNTIDFMGTSSLNFFGDYGTTSGTFSSPGISLTNPTLDSTSVIVGTGSTVAALTLNFSGITVNEGLIAASGADGSSVTIDVGTYVSNGNVIPGFFMNYGKLQATVGNSLTIAVGAGSEFFNVGNVVANGGSVLVTATGGAIVGGYAPTFGIGVIKAGGTLEQATGFPSTTAGAPPFYVFGDATAGNTLKIDNPGSFAGRIVNFQAGDTIDLGSPQSVSTIAATSDGRVQIQNGTSILETLVFATGDFIANTLTASVGLDGNTILTTAATNPNWTGSSGGWQTAGGWSTGTVPGTNDAAVIGLGAGSAFVLTTGNTAVSVNSLAETSGNATLKITSNTTVGGVAVPGGILQFDGALEVTSGNTLATTNLRQLSNSAMLQVDASSVLYFQGRANLGFPSAGTVAVTAGDSLGMFVEGTAVVDGLLYSANLVSNGTIVGNGGFIGVGVDAGSAPATMLVQGGTVVDTYAFLSSDPTSFGSLVLNGPNTVWNDAGDAADTANTRGYMLVGADNQSANIPLPTVAGTASMLVENRATLVEASFAEIGASTGSRGGATIASGGFWAIGTAVSGGFLNVGNGANSSGTLAIVGGAVDVLPGNGTLVFNGTASGGHLGLGIGFGVGSDGTVSVQSGALNVLGGGIGVGKTGSGMLDVLNGGTVSVSGANAGIGVGISGSAYGSVYVSGGLIALNGGGMTIGNAGTGVVTVENGGVIGALNTATSAVVVGARAGGTGTLLVQNSGSLMLGSDSLILGGSLGAVGSVVVTGMGSRVVQQGGTAQTPNIVVGLTGAGLLSVQQGAVVGTPGAVTIGGQFGTVVGGAGTVVVAGSNVVTNGTTSFFSSTLTASGVSLGLAAQSTGTLIVQTQGVVDVTAVNGIGGVAVGVAAGSFGSIDVNSGLLALAGSPFQIGQSGTGLVSVENGGTIVSSGGTLTTVSIGTSAGGFGSLTVGGGGLFLLNNQGLNVGAAIGATASVTVSGAGAHLSSVGGGTLVVPAIEVGLLGTGVMSILNGGSVSAAGSLVIGGGFGGAAAGTGTVSLSGAGSTLTVGGISVGQATLSAGLLQIGVNSGVAVMGTVTEGGGAFGPSGGNGTIMVAGSLVAGGPLTVWTGSTLSVSVGGGVDVGLSGSIISGSVLIENGQTLRGDGLIAAALVDNGLLQAVSAAIGAPGTLEVNGALSGTGTVGLGAGSILRLDGSVAASEQIAFASGSAETLLLANGMPGTISAQIGGLAVGDRIDFRGVTTITSVVNSPGTVTVQTDLGTYTFNNIAMPGGMAPVFSSAYDTITGSWGISVSSLVSIYTTATWVAGAGDWNHTSDWSPQGIPNSPTIDVVAATGSTAITISTGESFVVNALALDAGAVTVASGGMLTAADVYIGGNGMPVPGGSGTLTVAGSLRDTGILTVWNGSTLSAPGAIEVGNSGFLAPGELVIDAGHVVEGNGLIANTIVFNNGSVIASAALAPGAVAPGKLEINAALLGSGSVQIDSNATLQLDSSVQSGQTISFNSGGNGVLLLPDIAGFAGTISAFTAGDTIVVGTSSAATFSQNGSIVSVIESGITIGTLAFATSALATTAITTTNALVDNALCFLPDTLIATPSGEVKVQALRVGDLVVTASGSVRPIVWIGMGKVLATRGRRSAATPVIVRKNALGAGVPHYDLHVTKGHSLFIDGVLIPVEFLVNHRTILWDDQAREVSLFHIELEAHDILLANGAPAESYRDDGNRWLFQNANDGWDRPAMKPCAAVLTGGPVVDAIWQRLLDAAGPRPGLPLTQDADLHLLADGVRVDAARTAGRYVFRLNAAARDVRLVSRSGAPAELGLTRDPRELGVAVRRLEVWRGQRVNILEADDERLRDGFHAYEPACGHRWTNGDARVPAEMIDGPVDIVVHVADTATYPAFGEAVQAA